jgi:hypothetical protein
MGKGPSKKIGKPHTRINGKKREGNGRKTGSKR